MLFVLVHGCTICSILTQERGFCCWLGSYVSGRMFVGVCLLVDSQHNTYALIDHRSEDGIDGGTRLHSGPSSTRSVVGQV